MFRLLRAWVRLTPALISIAFLASLLVHGVPAADSFRFAILGDRTGEAQPGVYEQVWKEVAAENPALVVSVGDTIQGTDDATAEAEWRQVRRILDPFSRYPLYLAPGNHDVWSPASKRLFERYAAHPLHYSFNYGPAHFTVLDNSQSDELSNEELSFLEADLKANPTQPIKIIVSHRPSWLVNVALRNPDFALHKLAARYGVRYVIAGHLHQMLCLQLEGITYISMPSSGGHLRLSKAYADGWFFGHALVEIQGTGSDFRIKETGAPNGEGRITRVGDWGMAGLLKKNLP
jgi:predicted phosphodiesterase